MKKAVSISILMIFFACNTNKKQEDKQIPHNNHNMSGIPLTGYADSINAGLIVTDTMKSSPARTVMATVGKTHLHISYHSPGVKGRIIWGGLVPYNTVWVTGAHSATNLQVNKPIEINNKKVEAGTYAIFTIPGENEWIFILNKNHTQHLTDDYTESEDVLRIKVSPDENKMTPRLTYTVNKTDGFRGEITMLWEKIKIGIPFKTL